jgi:hypothetical protein
MEAGLTGKETHIEDWRNGQEYKNRGQDCRILIAWFPCVTLPPGMVTEEDQPELGSIVGGWGEAVAVACGLRDADQIHGLCASSPRLPS